MLAPKEIAVAVTKALDEKKGMDIRLLKIDRVSTLADYFLICTGTSNTHVRTLCDYAEYTLTELGEPMLGREGHRGNSWECWTSAPSLSTCLPMRPGSSMTWSACGQMRSRSI